MDNQIDILLENNFGFKPRNSVLLGGYSSRVWEVEINQDRNLVVKILKDQNDKDLLHHQAEVAFSRAVNSTGVIQTLKFIPDTKGQTIHRLHQDGDDYFVVIEPHPIVHKVDLSKEEQQNLGHLMSVVHSMFVDFDHPGLGTTKYMREVNLVEMDLIAQAFPDEGYKSYLKFMQPLDYQTLGLTTTVIHGDWHQANMSFTQPPFLFDLETLARGTRVEELARTITHWWMEPTAKKVFFENLVRGYQDLTQAELEIIPQLAITQLYRKYAEFISYNDPKNANRVRESIPVIKSLFNLP